MAFTVQALDASGFDATLIDQDEWKVFAAALAGNLAAVNMTLPLGRGANFRVRGRTTAAETGTILDLTAQGVTFPAGFFRIVEYECFVSGASADETGYLKRIAAVSGGTTPLLRVIQNGATAGVDQVQFNAVAGAGLAATPLSVVAMATNNVTITVTSAEAEILNWAVNCRVHKAQPLILGV